MPPPLTRAPYPAPNAGTVLQVIVEAEAAGSSLKDNVLWNEDDRRVFNSLLKRWGLRGGSGRGRLSGSTWRAGKGKKKEKTGSPPSGGVGWGASMGQQAGLPKQGQVCHEP